MGRKEKKMIVGTKRDMVMSPESLAKVNECGFDYIGSLCVKYDFEYAMLPIDSVGGFSAHKFGNAYWVGFGRESGEPDWAHGEDCVTNIDIFVARKGKQNGEL